MTEDRGLAPHISQKFIGGYLMSIPTCSILAVEKENEILTKIILITFQLD